MRNLNLSIIATMTIFVASACSETPDPRFDVIDSGTPDTSESDTAGIFDTTDDADTGTPDTSSDPDVEVDVPVENCGDGILAGEEQCDDTNLLDGDGCSATCEIEEGWSCDGEPSTCTEDCGDGQITGEETCDDGNTESGDGCSDMCVVEEGWSCEDEPSTCEESDCGDGTRQIGESCDDGNTVAGDGCSATCEIEPGWICTETSGTSECEQVCSFFPDVAFMIGNFEEFFERHLICEPGLSYKGAVDACTRWSGWNIVEISSAEENDLIATFLFDWREEVEGTENEEGDVYDENFIPFAWISNPIGEVGYQNDSDGYNNTERIICDESTDEPCFGSISLDYKENLINSFPSIQEEDGSCPPIEDAEDACIDIGLNTHPIPEYFYDHHADGYCYYCAKYQFGTWKYTEYYGDYDDVESQFITICEREDS